MQENTGVCILLRQSYKVYLNVFQVKISMVFLLIEEEFAHKDVFLSLAEVVSVSECFWGNVTEQYSISDFYQVSVTLIILMWAFSRFNRLKEQRPTSLLMWAAGMRVAL